jgi:rhodanese-related sulfurtransferase/CBS domain-containing protein
VIVVPTSIDRVQLQTLVGEGAQLAEVLPEDEYAEEHLPGALHLPLKSLSAETAKQLDTTKPVIVYCWDALCDMSPRAAWHLEQLGFRAVYDYTTGKADWIAAGLPTERREPAPARVTSAMVTDVPTCLPGEPVIEVVQRARSVKWEMAVVVNEHRVILGRLRLSRVDVDSSLPVAEVMEPGPVTVHADALLDATLQRLSDRHVETVIVSTPDGELLGVLRSTATRESRS